MISRFHFFLRSVLLTLVIVFSVALGTASFAVAANLSNQQSPVPQELLHSCPGRKDQVRCGKVTVPWDRKNPGNGSLSVAFEFYPHQDNSQPSAGTIVAQEGGPGGSTTYVDDFFHGIFAPMLNRYDLLLVDARGTGLSGAVHCPELDDGRGSYPLAIRRCAKRLGARAHLYGTAAAADDLQVVLDTLKIDQVTLYGDSYGTAFAQTFAARHPQTLRAIILDGAYTAGRADPLARDAAAAIRRAWHKLCAAHCDRKTLSHFAQLAREIRRRPIRGSANFAGKKRVIRFDEPAFVSLLYEADSNPVIYQQLDSAVQAALHRDRRRLLQLVAMTEALQEGGSVRDFSQGAYLAVHCLDDEQIWDRQASFQQRQEQFRRKRGQLAKNTFFPVSVNAWTDLSGLALTECIYWPKPPTLPDPLPVTGPDIPALILNGALDIRTPSSGARAVARWFPHSTFIEVANTGHVTAAYSLCAREIIRGFVATLRPGSTRCAKHEQIPELSRLTHTQLAHKI